MAKYLFQGNYVGAGVAGLLKEGGSSRIAVAKQVIESTGCTLDCFYFAFGEYDLVGIIDGPDYATVAALVLTINASGAVQLQTTVLLSAEDMDAATKLSPAYRPPGQ